MDRRVRKTKSQLRAGLAQLMREKSIREITVKELVDKVDINRSTFYLHYSDIPGMLKEIEDEILEDDWGEQFRSIRLREEKKVFIFLCRICSGCWQQTGKLAVRLWGLTGILRL